MIDQSMMVLMTGTGIAIIVLGVVVLAAGAWLVATYNRLVQRRNRIDNAWAQIDVQLKRRRDLVPNLVETVKGYAAHESATFEAVTRARAAAASASTPEQAAAAEGQLGQALSRLFAVAEAYPELKADAGFRDLQAQLAETENRITVSRQVYNDTVLTYQNTIQSFPAVLVAGVMGFTSREYFELADEAERSVPQVRFDSPPSDT
jgi:LemA protein